MQHRVRWGVVLAAAVLVAAAPAVVTLSLSTTSMTFEAPAGGPNPPAQDLVVTNTGAAALQWDSALVTAGASWLKIAPGTGHLGAGRDKELKVTVASAGLAPGTYTATLRFFEKGNPANFVDLTVTLNVLTPPFIDLRPVAGLTFSAPAGSGLQPAQFLTLTNTGGTTLNWTLTFSVTTPIGGTWLTAVTPASGTLPPGAPTSLTVTVDASGLAAGTYTGTIQVTGNASNPALPISRTVTLNVQTPAVLEVAPVKVDFSELEGNADPLLKGVTIRNAGGSPLNWTATKANGSSWLTVTPASGSGVLPGATVRPAFQIIVSAAGLVAGDYSDTVVIGGNASNAPVSIPVSFTVEAIPELEVQPLALTFNAPEGGPDPALQAITITNQGGGTLAWSATIAGASPWLRLNVSQGTTESGGSDQIQVVATVGSLLSGTYTDSIEISDGNGIVLSVFVTLNVNAGRVIQISPDHLILDVPESGAPHTTLTTLQNVGHGNTDLVWSAGTVAGWLMASPASGSLSSGEAIPLSITVDPAGKAPGTYVGHILVTGNAPNSPQVISVTMIVHPVPEIHLDPQVVVFDVAQGGGAEVQSVLLENTGGGADLIFTMSESAAWLDVTPGAGTLPAGESIALSIIATPGSLAPGVHTAYVTVDSPNASNGPQEILVRINVITSPKIGLTPASLVFNLPVGSPASSQSVSIKDVGGSPTPLAFSVPVPAAAWLTASPSNGNVPSGASGTLTVTVTTGANLPGTYTGLVQVDSANALNAPQLIPVTMNLTALPRIALSPATLTITTGIGATPSNRTLTVTNTGGATLNWSAAASVSTPPAWLSLSGTTTGALGPGLSATFDTAIDVTGLAAGTYAGRVTVTAAGSANTPQFITVTLNVLSHPEVTVSPATLSFSTPIGTAPTAQSVTVKNDGGSPLDWTASATVTTPAAGTWLALTGTTSGTGLAAGTSALLFGVGIDVTGLPRGTYTGFVRVTGSAPAENSPQDIPVTLHVLSQPSIGLAPPALVLTMTRGFGNPANQTVTVTNTGDLTLTWTASASVATPTGGTWLTLLGGTAGSLSGGLSASFDVAVDGAGLAAGSYSGTIMVAGGAGTTNTPQTIGVTLIVNEAPASATLPSVGYVCGSIGFDVGLPLIALWLLRRRRSRAFALLAGVALSLAAAVPAQAGDFPTSLSQEEAPSHAKSGLLDFSGTALSVHAGVLDFSSDFKADPEFCAGIGLRVPSPWLSGIVSSEPDRVGAFFDVTGSGIHREAAGSGDKSSMIFFVTGGFYGVLVRTEWIETQVEAAIQYGSFGDVDNVNEGIAGLIGIRGALNVGKGMAITLDPQVAFGNAGARIYFLSAGLDLRF